MLLMSPSVSNIGRRLGAWLYHQRWVFFIFLAALLVRLHWNAQIHPPGDYVYSDMNGYVGRADRMLKEMAQWEDYTLTPWFPVVEGFSHKFKAHEYSSFFPFGTHWLVAAIKAHHGQDNFEAVGRVYAWLGAIAVAAAYAVARRASRFPNVVAPAVGLLGIFYYPHLSLGGYVLSEIPYCAFFMLTLLFFMRMIDEGRHIDAWLMGICCAIAMCFRPQILLSGATIGLFWVLRRKSVPKLKLVHLIEAFVPVAIGLALCASLMKHNTGRSGLISENGSFNLVFGRCHNSKIQSMPDGEGHGRVHFRPPPFLQLNSAEKRKAAKGETPAMILDPAIDDVLSYKGYIGDREQHMAFVRECVKITGPWGQLKYSYTNVALLWRHNIPWPDSGRKQWRGVTRWWTARYREFLAIPALLGISLMCFRRTAKAGFVAANVLAMVILAAIYFGGTRHRTTYDFASIFVAIEVYAYAVYGIWRWVASRRARGRIRPAPPPG